MGISPPLVFLSYCCYRFISLSPSLNKQTNPFAPFFWFSFSSETLSPCVFTILTQTSPFPKFFFINSTLSPSFPYFCQNLLHDHTLSPSFLFGMHSPHPSFSSYFASSLFISDSSSSRFFSFPWFCGLFCFCHQFVFFHVADPQIVR